MTVFRGNSFFFSLCSTLATASLSDLSVSKARYGPSNLTWASQEVWRRAVSGLAAAERSDSDTWQKATNYRDFLSLIVITLPDLKKISLPLECKSKHYLARSKPKRHPDAASDSRPDGFQASPTPRINPSRLSLAPCISLYRCVSNDYVKE